MQPSGPNAAGIATDDGLEETGMPAAAVRGYFDGSRTGDRYVTLAGYIGPPEAWSIFDERWRAVLESWHLPYMHMREANVRRGPFEGWSPQRVDGVMRDLFNNCLAPAGWGQFRGKFVGAACTVNLDDHARARSELPRLRDKEPEAICVDHVVTIALTALPIDLEERFGKAGTVELIFDQGEKFRHTIDRVRQSRARNRPAVLDLVSLVGDGNMRAKVGLQAADLLAWHTNRYRRHGFLGAPISGAIRVFATPNYETYFDYEILKKQFA